MMMAPLQRRDGGTPPQPSDLAHPSPTAQDRRATLSSVFVFALIANAIAGVLLVLDMVVEGNDELFELLTGLDLLVMGGAVLFGVRRLRADAVASAAAEEFAALAREKQAAETANLAKSRYLASVSHEIRSPLNAIYGYAQLFERGDGVNAQEAARVILRSAEHLTNLVEGLLDISQLEFGVLRVRNEEVHLKPFLDQVVSMMRPAALSKGLNFVYEPPARMPDLVRLDAGRFRQVLINLLSNAIKFTEHGAVTLSVKYSGQIAVFEVRDTGPGIAPEDRERIFERFERGTAAEQHDPARGTRTKPGAGLGLAIARTIVEILGGKLELESDLGVGSCFRITMMISEVAGRVVPHVPVRKLIGYEGRQRSILLVEDDGDQRQFLQQLLLSLGFKVRAWPNGEAALAALGDEPLDLAILDISLPGLSGWEIGVHLRDHFGEALQILMLSANSEELHRPDFDTPRHDRFLVKPVEFETLAETIGELLQLTWRWDDAQADPATPATGSDAEPPEALDEKALPHVAKLREFLRIGYVRGIEAEIQHLEKAAPDAEPWFAGSTIISTAMTSPVWPSCCRNKKNDTDSRPFRHHPRRRRRAGFAAHADCDP